MGRRMIRRPLAAGGLLLLVLAGAQAARARARAALEVRVDPRVELFSILWRLAGVPEYNKAADTPYLRAVQARFGPLADHPAVRRARALYRDGSISFNAPLGLAVHLDSAVRLRPLAPLEPLPARLDSRWRKAPAADFLAAARDFARQSDFMGFFRAQRRYRRAVEGRYRRALGQADPLGWCQDFFGPKRGLRATLVPGLLVGPNGYGLSVALPGRGEALWPVLGVSRVDAKGLPRLRDRRGLLAWLQHELAHAYVNPAVDANAAALEAVGRKLFAGVAGPMKKQAYDNWKVMLYETVVRASTVLYLKDTFGQPAAAAELRRARQRSFLWLGPVVAALDAYRSRRRSHPGFGDAVASLAAVLDRWQRTPVDKRGRPFEGPINALFEARYRRAGQMVVVAPRVSPSDPGSQAAADYVAQAHRRFFAGHGVGLAPVDELDAASRRRGLVVYGTPQSNPLLAELLADFGWQVEPDGIRLGQRRFAGRHLVLIACHPNPAAAGRPVGVYAAAASGDLVGIHNLFHGPTDWIVARRVGEGRFAEVARGDFPKTLAGEFLPLPRR